MWDGTYDLSKTFDRLSHDSVIAKIHAYGFGCMSLYSFKR